MRRLTPILAVVLSCLLAACSLTRLAYSNAALAYANATPVLAWMVGDYIEMSDFQCPTCGRAHKMIEPLISIYEHSKADPISTASVRSKG